MSSSWIRKLVFQNSCIINRKDTPVYTYHWVLSDQSLFHSQRSKGIFPQPPYQESRETQEGSSTQVLLPLPGLLLPICSGSKSSIPLSQIQSKYHSSGKPSEISLSDHSSSLETPTECALCPTACPRFGHHIMLFSNSSVSSWKACESGLITVSSTEP